MMIPQLKLMISKLILQLISNIDRIMSLIRKASKATLRLTTEDFTSCMDQKNAIISSLQNEVESLRSNQQKCDRVKEELAKARARYESLLRDHDVTTSNNQERLQLSYRNVYELRIQAEHLEDQLKLKAQSLKEAKFNSQQLLSYQNKKEDEATEIKIKFQEQKSLGEVRKMEEERTRLQIAQIRQQVEKGRRQNTMIRTQTQTINEKCYKTQSYIRSLMREQSNLSENLSRIEDENNKLDSSISQLDTVVSINHGQISNKQKDCQELQFRIASKELQKKKLQNQIREKVKMLSSEKQKWKSLCQNWEQKKYDGSRVEGQVNQASSQINFIISKNNEIVEVNQQLRQDLKVCQRHLENVCRVNKSMDGQIQVLHTTNLKAISKLQQPFANRTNTSNSYGVGKWGNTSRMTDFQTGDFQKKSSR